jgi:hypothetical protein
MIFMGGRNLSSSARIENGRSPFSRRDFPKKEHASMKKTTIALAAAAALAASLPGAASAGYYSDAGPAGRRTADRSWRYLGGGIPPVTGPCVVRERTAWIYDSPVSVREPLCRWYDGTIRPLR